MTPTVWAVIPVHNGISHTLKALSSLTEDDYGDLKIVVIDDGSTDGTHEQVSRRFPDVTVLSGDGNLWWSGATNLGVEHALSEGADYIFTINNDVELRLGSVAALVRAAEARPQTIVGSKICYSTAPDRVWYFGASFDKTTGILRHREGDSSSFTAPAPSDWLTGMGTLIPAPLFREVGFYDAGAFPQYFGDVDHSLRAKYHGYDLLVSPEAVVYADVASSWIPKQIADPHLRFLYDVVFSPRSPHNIRSRHRFYCKHSSAHPWRTLASFYLDELPRLGREFGKAYLKAKRRVHAVS